MLTDGWSWKSHQGCSKVQRTRFRINPDGFLLDPGFTNESQVINIADPALAQPWERSCFRNQRKLQDPRGFYSSHSYCKPSSPSISVLGGKRSPRFLANGIATCTYPMKELNSAAAPALFPDTLALANSKQSNVKYILLHCWADGIAWRKLQKATGQMAAALFFPRYFINPRESKEIYWILNSSFTYSLKSSSASKLAVTAGLQLAVILKSCLKVWEVSFWGGIKR